EREGCDPGAAPSIQREVGPEQGPGIHGACLEGTHGAVARHDREYGNRTRSDRLRVPIGCAHEGVPDGPGACQGLHPAGSGRVRELEVACGPCIGMGFSPPIRGASVRTFNRNFEGRSGTADDLVYLCSPETAAATALEGKITDPRDLGKLPAFQEPTKYPVDTSG